ncbi:MAG: hypothetical protein ACRDJH_23130 [Thermomicrobiales bacterium]
MSDNGVTCGNCGGLNDPATEFCINCGVLLAAYQSPTGARPSAVERQPTASAQQDAAAPPPPRDLLPPPEPAAAEPPDPPISTKPESGGDARAEEVVAHSVDDIFGPLSDVEEHPATGASALEETPDISPRAAALVEEQPEPATERAGSAPQLTSSVAAIGSANQQETTRGPVDVERQPVGGQTRSTPPSLPPSPSPRWSTSDQGYGAFGQAGQRVSSTPPQTLIVIGSALILAACVLGPTASAVDLPLIFEGPMWCAFPIGVIVLVIGVIQLVSRRPNKF